MSRASRESLLPPAEVRFRYRQRQPTAAQKVVHPWQDLSKLHELPE
ncbi:hypothetical protein ACU2QU_003211 [Escherichia coli]